MNNKIKGAALIIMIAGSASFAACKKCKTCSYKVPTTGITTTRELCGSQVEIDHFVADVTQEAKAFGTADEDIICKDK